MKIKIVFLISAMNALSYLCFGNCCDDCCNCWDNCGEKEEKGVDENEKNKNWENVKEDKNEKEIKNDNNPEYFVNSGWLDKKNQGNFVLKLFNKEEEKKYKSKDGIQLELEVKEGNKTEIKDLDKLNEQLKTGTGKWALFEIKYKKEGEEDNFVYLYCSDIESVEVDYLMTGIFDNKKNFFSISVLACDTSKVEKMNSMFFNCFILNKLDLSNFNTENVTDMSRMFYNCCRLYTLDLSKFNTEKCTKMYEMFYGCDDLMKLDLSSFFTSFDLEKKNLYTLLDKNFLRDSLSLEFVYFKNENIAEAFCNYCNYFIVFSEKKPERKYEKIYDEQKKLYCVQITKIN